MPLEPGTMKAAPSSPATDTESKNLSGRIRMTKLISEEAKDDLLGRGYSRRQMMRAAMMFSTAAAATAFTLSPEMAFAQEDREMNAKVRIGQNECWTGPMAPGAAAAAAVISQSNRYSPNDEHGQLVKAISQIENVPADHIMT